MVRSFLNVGQGAFYCECFENNILGNNLNIVYDCGSLTDIKIVERAIRNNFQKGEIIEALFISHLDEDHINGVPYLLKYCKVKRIYFPIITLKNRKLVQISYFIKKTSGFAYNFFENPNRAIESLGIDYSPELVQIKEQGFEDSDQRELDINDITQKESGTNIFDDIKNDELFKGIMLDKWIYKPFNFRQKERIEKLMKNLNNQFGRIITEKDLEQIWNNNSKGDIDKIKEAYKKVPGGFNTNSMTLFSGEIYYNLDQFIYMSNIKYYYRICKWYRKPSGCLYTGDYDASGKLKWKQLMDAYKDYWEHIGCVQIPHHGSKHNFNDNFVKMNAFFVISSGYLNRFHHPHSIVIKSFLLKHIMPYIVTEQIGSAVNFCIW